MSDKDKRELYYTKERLKELKQEYSDLVKVNVKLLDRNKLLEEDNQFLRNVLEDIKQYLIMGIQIKNIDDIIQKEIEKKDLYDNKR